MATFDVRMADDETLLTRLLAPAAGEEDARRYASQVLYRFGSLGAALAAPRVEVERTLGPDGHEHARRLATLHQLLLCLLRDRIADRPLIASSEDLRAYLTVSLGHLAREQFRVLHLDAGRHLIFDELMNHGTIDHAPVYPREVVRRALELGAKHLILVHNHPSGDPTPSLADRNITDQVERGCRVFEIEVFDHIVVGRNELFSFRENDLLLDRATQKRTNDRRRSA